MQDFCYVLFNLLLFFDSAFVLQLCAKPFQLIPITATHVDVNVSRIGEKLCAHILMCIHSFVNMVLSQIQQVLLNTTIIFHFIPQIFEISTCEVCAFTSTQN